MKGTVKFFHDRDEYGFIEAEDEEEDVFFHESDLDGIDVDDVEEGMELEFEVEQAERGPKAVNVKEA